jgi:uncharacterized membrane protein YhiD involved in acid resistance
MTSPTRIASYIVSGIGFLGGGVGQAEVVADVYSIDRKHRAIQDVMSRLNIEPDVRSVSWEKVQ